MLCKQLVAIWLTIANLFHSKILQGGLFSSAKVLSIGLNLSFEEKFLQIIKST